MFPRDEGRNHRADGRSARLRLASAAELWRLHKVCVRPASVSERRSRLRRRNKLARLRKSLRFVKRIEDEFVSAVRLTAPLRAESEEIHTSLAELHFKRGGFALNAVAVQ